MVAPVRLESTAEVLTTDATPTTLYDAGSILSQNKFVFAIVSAMETTLLTRTDHRVFIVAGQSYANFEATLTAVNVDGGNNGTGAAGWTAQWVNSGGNLVLQVTGEASVDITWRAIVYEADGR